MIQAIAFDWGDTLMLDNTSMQGSMAYWPKVKAMPGALDMLQLLHRDYRLFVATNAKDSVEQEIYNALDRVSMAKYFEKIFCYHSLGLTKSDPGYFSQVIRYIGEPPENIVMVGDSYTRDIVPALAQGMRGVWLNAGCSIHESKVPVIRSLNELSGLVDSINAID